MRTLKYLLSIYLLFIIIVLVSALTSYQMNYKESAVQQYVTKCINYCSQHKGENQCTNFGIHNNPQTECRQYFSYGNGIKNTVIWTGLATLLFPIQVFAGLLGTGLLLLALAVSCAFSYYLARKHEKTNYSLRTYGIAVVVMLAAVLLLNWSYTMSEFQDISRIPGTLTELFEILWTLIFIFHIGSLLGFWVNRKNSKKKVTTKKSSRPAQAKIRSNKVA